MKTKRFLKLFLSSMIICSSGISESLKVDQWFDVGVTPFVAASDGYYLLFDDYLYYYDPDSFSPTLMCSRLNCLHQAEENPADCEAYFPAVLNLTWYDEHLYIEGYNGDLQSRFVRMLPDGTERQEWGKLYQNQDIGCIKKGFQGPYYFFEEISSSVSEDFALHTEHFLYFIDLNQMERGPVLIETWNGEAAALMLLQVSEDQLLYLTGTLDGEKVLWRYDLVSKNREELYRSYETAYYFYADDQVYMLKTGEGIYLLSHDYSEKQAVFTGEEVFPETRFYGDGTYFYGVTAQEQGIRLCIMDLTGKKLAEADVPSATVLRLISEEHLFFQTENSGTFPGIVVSIDSVLSGNPVVQDFILPETNH